MKKSIAILVVLQTVFLLGLAGVSNACGTPGELPLPTETPELPKSHTPTPTTIVVPTPTVSFEGSFLEGLADKVEDRVGRCSHFSMHEKAKRKIYDDLVLLEDILIRESRKRSPTEVIQLEQEGHQILADKYGITLDQVECISVEGDVKQWLTPSFDEGGG